MISLILVIKFVLGTLKFTNGEEVNSCHIYSNEIAGISKWSELILKSQDDKRINQIFDKSGIKIKSKMEESVIVKEGNTTHPRSRGIKSKHIS